MKENYSIKGRVYCFGSIGVRHALLGGWEPAYAGKTHGTGTTIDMTGTQPRRRLRSVTSFWPVTGDEQQCEMQVNLQRDPKACMTETI
jgi:hypothetical protein